MLCQETRTDLLVLLTTQLSHVIVVMNWCSCLCQVKPTHGTIFTVRTIRSPYIVLFIW
jgi:hypothetical protein